MDKIETICAVVVSYNRKKMLLECLGALLGQTYPLDAIYIIDNASTDGTPQSLYDEGYIKELINSTGELKEIEHTVNMRSKANPDRRVKIHYVRMYENTGGAGGFYEGVKRCYEKGYDWIWMMDDDSEPLSDSLENLLKDIHDRRSEYISFAALKIGIDGNIQEHQCGYIDEHSFIPTPIPHDIYANGERLIKIGYSTFVGFLIPITVVEKAGFPDKDFFIWNDDIEYCVRISSVGEIYLNKKAVIRHKDRIEDKSDKGKFLFLTSRERRIEIPNYWKRYYCLRNILFILKKYNTNPLSRYILYLKIYFRTIAGILIYDNFKSARLGLVFKSLVDGINKKMGKTLDPKTWRSRFVELSKKD